MTQIDTDKLRALDDAARRPGPAQHFRAALLKGELVSMVPAILAMAEDNRRLREALDWALNEIRCTTRYDNEGQFWNAYDIARQALAAPGDGG